MSAGQDKRGVVAVLNDLIFETKLRSTAKSLGVGVTSTRSCTAMVGAFQKSTPSLVIIDLNSAENAEEAVKAAVRQASKPHVVAFVSHVDETLASAAHEAGAHEVLARSRFNTQLPQLLQVYGGVAVVPDPSI